MLLVPGVALPMTALSPIIRQVHSRSPTEPSRHSPPISGSVALAGTAKFVSQFGAGAAGGTAPLSGSTAAQEGAGAAGAAAADGGIVRKPAACAASSSQAVSSI